MEPEAYDPYWRCLREHIRREFRFLETEYGYHCSSDSGIGVTFANGSTTVSIFQGRPADAIEIDFCGSVRAGVDLSTIAEWCKRPAPGTQAYEPTFQRVLANLASFVRQNCGPLLRGDKQAFAVLGAIALKHHAMYNERLRSDQGRREVAEAWSKRDYALVARLLAKADWVLRPSERKMLSIAQRKAREAK